MIDGTFRGRTDEDASFETTAFVRHTDNIVIAKWLGNPASSQHREGAPVAVRPGCGSWSSYFERMLGIS